MIPKPAQYLLRLDDLCPTIPRSRWQPFRALIEEFRVHPILAIVPDNQDTDLQSGPYDATFWDEMRELEAAGAVVAMHGYQHLCYSYGESLLGIHRQSEFAGVDLKTQREWIRAGITILREKGLNPRLWVAPRHGFDFNTLRALQDEGMEWICDGFARVPFRRHGVTWIPQQLWAPESKATGLWTICIHPYAAPSSEVDQLRTFLNSHGQQFTSFEQVVKEFDGRGLGLIERLREWVAVWRVQIRHERSRRRRRKRPG